MSPSLKKIYTIITKQTEQRADAWLWLSLAVKLGFQVLQGLIAYIHILRPISNTKAKAIQTFF